MEKDPAARYQSAAEMRSDIQRALSGFPVARPAQMTAAYGGPGAGTRRMDPMGQTSLQTGGLPPYQYGQEETGVRGPRRRKVWPWVAAVLALAVIAGLIFAYKLVSGTHNTSSSKTTVVPSGLKSMTLPNAEKTLKRAGLKWHTVSHKAQTPPYNTVTSTSPAAGTKVSKDSFVTLNYNVPPGATAIPEVRGKNVQEATAILKNAGFKNITTGRRVASLTVPAGEVVRTRPPQGKVEPLNTPILLIVSGGGVRVPHVIGVSETEAIGRLNRAGIFYHIITQ